MKRFGLGLACLMSGWMVTGDATAQAPATLGIPKASLGLPVAPRTITQAAATLEPIVRAQGPELVSPYFIQDAPSKTGDKTPVLITPKIEKKPEPLPNPTILTPAMPKTPSADAAPITSGPGPLATPLPGNYSYPAPYAIGGMQVMPENGVIPLPGTAYPIVMASDPYRFRVSAEYLAWATKSSNSVPLVTTGPLNTRNNGIIGATGVTTLLGSGSDESLLDRWRSGGRLNTTYWMKHFDGWGLDATGYMLADEGKENYFYSAQYPLLARPFFNVNDGVNSSELIASPGDLTGNVLVSSSQRLYGGDINLRRSCYDNCLWRMDALVGYRFAYLGEDLQITENVLGVPTSRVPGAATTNSTAYDRFATKNYFNGGQVGAIFESNHGRWTFDVRAKVGLGVTTQKLSVSGSQTVTAPDGTVSTFNGGLLALNSNIGEFSQNKFSVNPEFNFNIGYNVTDHCRVFVGYSFMYWSSVLRPADQIDTGLDVNRIPNFRGSANVVTTPRPAVLLRDTTFWAQGLNAGLQLQW